MIARTLEPEVVDTPEEAREYSSIDHREANRRFLDDLLKLRPRLDRVLDVCTGPADIPLELCLRRPEARIVAVDYARNMLRLAQAKVEQAGLGDRLRLQRADAKKLPFADNSFTAALCNGSLHHIPEPRQALSEMLRVTAPCGLLFVRDLMRPTDEGQFRFLMETHASGMNARQQALFAASLRAALTLEEVRRLVEELGIYGDAVQATSDRHWTLAAVAS